MNKTAVKSPVRKPAGKRPVNYVLNETPRTGAECLLIAITPKGYLKKNNAEDVLGVYTEVEARSNWADDNGNVTFVCSVAAKVWNRTSHRYETHQHRLIVTTVGEDASELKVVNFYDRDAKKTHRNKH